MLFIACNSIFSAAKSSRELQNARSFPDPKVTAFCCFYLEENGDLICHEVSGKILSSVSAFCFMQFYVRRFEKPQITSAWYRQQSFQFEVYFQALLCSRNFSFEHVFLYFLR